MNNSNKYGGGVEGERFKLHLQAQTANRQILAEESKHIPEVQEKQPDHLDTEAQKEHKR